MELNIAEIKPTTLNELMKIKQESLSGPQKLRMTELNNNFNYNSLDPDLKKMHMKNQL